MDVAKMSMSLSQMQLQQDASMAVMKMAMDTAMTQTADITDLLESSMKTIDPNVKAMEQSVQPHLGGNIDLYL
ncbi:YjfB family protein [Desulfuribacillus alkaliarsenatis]|uniref:Motility protein n=1 Tax=Desulfuribacillus alkaliarsenatis TaxID=766136 RepID=A0A1E5G3S5_9FIRM|nr:YjfB family protein [Desulfuribacillus alkaliarsenatis]OEF97731.1 hypothetical protein BHF68_14130 [Desulfuribacillus alkaliarsenatis]